MAFLALVVLSVFAASCAQILLKQGAKNHYSSFIRQYINPWVIGGYGILGLSLIINVICMNHGVQVKEISIIESFSYLFVPFLSWLFFKETIGWRKVGAMAVVMMGIIVFFIDEG